jgi:hypothetical protein
LTTGRRASNVWEGSIAGRGLYKGSISWIRHSLRGSDFVGSLPVQDGCNTLKMQSCINPVTSFLLPDGGSCGHINVNVNYYKCMLLHQFNKIYMYVCVGECMCVYIYISKFVCMCLCVCVYIYTYVCIYMYVQFHQTKFQRSHYQLQHFIPSLCVKSVKGVHKVLPLF